MLNIMKKNYACGKFTIKHSLPKPDTVLVEASLETNRRINVNP